jgi:hypothetical protein
VTQHARILDAEDERNTREEHIKRAIAFACGRRPGSDLSDAGGGGSFLIKLTNARRLLR